MSPISPVATQHELTWIRMVEETGPRMFSLKKSGIVEWRGYVDRVKQEIGFLLAGCFIQCRLTIHRKDRPFDPN